jgi:TetR/AcrR family transcriptional regulator, tetracycline repressor protein
MARSAKSELSRSAIVQRALDIADTEGLDAITIRRIGKEFGVTPMALYWHVQNKDELLDAMGDALFADTSADVDAKLPWIEQLRALVWRLVEALRIHPGAVQLAFGRVLLTEAGLRLAEAVFDLLRAAGFSVRESAAVGTHALRTAVMLVADEPGRQFGSSDEEREALLAHKRAAIQALPVDRFPRLREAGDALFECDDEDEYYSFGVDLYVSGVAQLQQQLVVSG